MHGFVYFREMLAITDGVIIIKNVNRGSLAVIPLPVSFDMPKSHLPVVERDIVNFKAGQIFLQKLGSYGKYDGYSRSFIDIVDQSFVMTKQPSEVIVINRLIVGRKNGLRTYAI